ncbi:GerAB/ArcD/ProY family transporter [Peribacillus sp. TH27]|nr:GerAB/ArcD/ProY family transporter [Peribacillus sp. TH27]
MPKVCSWRSLGYNVSDLINLFCFDSLLFTKTVGHYLWPTLTTTSIIELPFIQRFEYIFIAWGHCPYLPHQNRFSYR